MNHCKSLLHQGLNTRFALICWLAAGLVGCTSSHVNRRTVDLNQRIGSYSYRQAVADLGPPDTQYQDYRGDSAEWLLIKPLPVTFDLGFECHYTEPTPGGYGGLLRLNFAKDGQLKSWKRIEYGLAAHPSLMR